MDIPVYRLIDLARLLFFRALLLETERRRDVSSSTSAHDTLQTARTHRRRAARRGRGVRPTGTPLSAHGFDSRQRAVDLRPMPDLCGQRARRRRLFAFDANGELIEAPTPAGDAPFAKRTARSSRGVADFSRGTAGLSRGAVPPLTEIVSSDLLDSPFPERGVQSPKRSVCSSERSVPSLTEIVSSDLLDSPFPERGVQSPKRSVPSKTGTLHTQAADGVVAGEARYAALAKRSAQTADRLLRRVSRHRAKGK